MSRALSRLTTPLDLLMPPAEIGPDHPGGGPGGSGGRSLLAGALDEEPVLLTSLASVRVHVPGGRTDSSASDVGSS
jgi:hypothetical protein